MQEVQAVCDRVIIIHQGKLVADDPIGQLQERLRAESVVTVEFQQAVQSKVLAAIPGVVKVRTLGERRFQLIAEAEADIRPQVSEFARQQGLSLLEIHREQAGVEEVFRTLTRS